MTRDVLTFDLFPGAPVARHPPHIAAARRAFDEWKRRGARRNHPAYRTMIEHLRASCARRAG